MIWSYFIWQYRIYVKWVVSYPSFKQLLKNPLSPQSLLRKRMVFSGFIFPRSETHPWLIFSFCILKHALTFNVKYCSVGLYIPGQGPKFTYINFVGTLKTPKTGAKSTTCRWWETWNSGESVMWQKLSLLFLNQK